ncbi:hypothetical protein HK405_003199, partial [Cladochytrium tenue]
MTGGGGRRRPRVAKAIAYLAVDLTLRKERDAVSATDPSESSCGAQAPSVRVALADIAAAVELYCISAELRDSTWSGDCSTTST